MWPSTTPTTSSPRTLCQCRRIPRGTAEAAVAERLAACAQIQGPLKSTFHWRGGVDHSTEWYCHLKTTRKRLPALEALIRALHPYAVPEIIAVDIVAGHEPYLSWIEATVRGE